MKKAKELFNSNSGITLIALVVTIIVLIILAGISINLILGENGIITKSSEAKDLQSEASEKEQILLAMASAQIDNIGEVTQNTLQKSIDDLLGKEKAVVTYNGNGTYSVEFIEEKREYQITQNKITVAINWNDIMKTAKAPENQKEERNNGVIGIGTDGKTVNMDLWEYTKLADGTYALNDEATLNGEGTRTSGYDNANLVNGKIQGSVPKYIKTSLDDSFIEVTNVDFLFYKSNLEEAPLFPNTVKSMWATFDTCTNLTKVYSIPNNVTNMRATFSQCTSLYSVPDIPNSVTNMRFTFNGCSSLVNSPKISENVTDMYATFSGCIILKEPPIIPSTVTTMEKTFNECRELIKAPEIPNAVTNMRATFNECKNLITGPSRIPNTVTNMYATFRNCNKLEGKIIIDANLTGAIIEDDIKDYSLCLFKACTDSNINLILSGDCPILNLIIEETNNTNITVQ